MTVMTEEKQTTSRQFLKNIDGKRISIILGEKVPLSVVTDEVIREFLEKRRLYYGEGELPQ